MHESVILFGQQTIMPGYITDKRVLEVGSHYVNGSLRYMVERMKPKSYTGIDIIKGDCVDMVVDAQSMPFKDEEFDFIICTEMLEHVKDWALAIKEMKRVLAHDGIILITTRSEGFPYHEPPDRWRYTVQNLRDMFTEYLILELKEDPQMPTHPGVFLKAQKIGEDVTDFNHIVVWPAITGVTR